MYILLTYLPIQMWFIWDTEISVQKIDIDYCCISTLLFSTINLEVNYFSVVKNKIKTKAL